MVKWLNYILRFFFGVLLLPVAIAVSIALYRQLISLEDIGSPQQIYFFYGIIAYSIFHLLIYRPAKLYIFSHELLHTVSSWLFGGKTKQFQITDKGGSVTTTKSNTFINLAPYLFPIYAILIWLVYFLFSFFYNLERYRNPFLFLIGLSLAFHIIFSAELLKTKQSDLVKSGYLFSISIIYIVNISIVAFALNLIFPSFSFVDFFKSSYQTVGDIYSFLFRHLFL